MGRTTGGKKNGRRRKERDLKKETKREKAQHWWQTPNWKRAVLVPIEKKEKSMAGGRKRRRVERLHGNGEEGGGGKVGPGTIIGPKGKAALSEREGGGFKKEGEHYNSQYRRGGDCFR